MDASGISLARENNIPIVVHSIQERGALARVACGEGTFTVVSHPPAPASKA
jgi:uridylate kinase